MLSALIIDDEAPSREELRALLSAEPDVEVLGECSNAIEGLAAIHRLRPQVVFLDIQMPRLSGLEMAGMIDPAAEPLRQIPCIGRSKIFLLGLAEVEYVYTDVAGVQVVGPERQGTTELTLKILQERTPLLRCHRQYLVNTDQIAEIGLLDNGAAEIVTRSGKRLPVSRRYLREMKDRLLIG